MQHGIPLAYQCWDSEFGIGFVSINDIMENIILFNVLFNVPNQHNSN